MFHAEMDLEWAINGKLYLLQMRPITVDTYDLREFDRTDDVSTHVFTKRNVGEMMPGAVTPLTYSTSTYAIDYGMRYMMKKAGLIKRIDDQAPLRMITSWSGHLFFDMNLLYNMHARVAIASNLLSLSICFCACSNSRENTINSSLNSLELTGKVDIISNKNDIKSSYKSGEKIRIELSSVTDVSFYVFVNDQKVEESPYDSVGKYGVFEFDMPNEKATVVVTSDKFYHQVFCYADTKAFADSNVTNIQVKISGSDETGLATYYTSSDAQDIKNFKEVAHKEIKRSNANYSSNSVERRIYLKNEYTDGTDYICFIDSFDNYLCNSGDFNGPEVFEFVDSNYSIPTVSDKASVSYSFYDKTKC